MSINSLFFLLSTKEKNPTMYYSSDKQQRFFPSLLRLFENIVAKLREIKLLKRNRKSTPKELNVAYFTMVAVSCVLRERMMRFAIEEKKKTTRLVHRKSVYFCSDTKTTM